MRNLALTDPRRFLTDYPTKNGIILDEIQHAPQLLSYMQTIVDREKKNGYFIITGSQNFLVDEAITQTLAGRMAVLTLLPLSISELASADKLPAKIETLIHKGSYPKAHSKNVSIDRLYTNYLRLYVERDVRQIQNVSNLNTFQKFIRLCAAHTGRELNLTSLGNDCGINQTTARSWISILETSYVIFLLYPYYNNFGKRLVKTPKLYFIDTGIACNLLKIRTANELLNHYMRGSLVESLIISDFLKQQYNLEQQPSLYFWKDHTGNEIDCIISESKYPVSIEIKSAKTVTSDFFKELNYWQTITEQENIPQYLIYGGTENQKRTNINVLSWKAAGNLIETLIMEA